MELKIKNFLLTTLILISVFILGMTLNVSGTGGAGDMESKIKDILGRMTLEEKIDQMSGDISNVKMAINFVMGKKKYPMWTAPGLPRLSVPDIRSCDGPRGVATDNPSGIPTLRGLEGTTCFPAAMARGATWDPDLEKRISWVIGYEGRVLGANMVLSPCINVLRHPGWGRAQETYGEDPYHLGVMGVAHVEGSQEHVMSCPKHFAANSLEESRFFVNVKMDERTLREIYLPHFRMTVEAGAASIMSAYNDLNGYLCAHNKHLLRDILKGDWDFQGFVVSDWDAAVEDAVEAAEGGLDLEMPYGKHFGGKLKKAVKRGKVDEEIIDEAVERLLRMKFKFDGINPDTKYERSKVAGKDAAALALEAEHKGIVLLKNEGCLLPLKRDKLGSIAVIGRLADRENTGDNGSSNVHPPYVVTPLEGIKNLAGDNIEITHDNGVDPATASAAAAAADIAVVVVGMTRVQEGEFIKVASVSFGGDRENLDLDPADEAVIRAVCKANEKCIVILESGSAITMKNWKESARAIMMAWYPGMEGGNAIADVLFGKVNPSGKLPFTWPVETSQLFPLDNKSKEVVYGYYHGYRYYDKKKLIPDYHFGFGMCYTTYEYSNLHIARKELGGDDTLEVTVDVKNTGDMAGDEIVQLYVGYEGSAVDRPLKDLKAFDRVGLAPGEKKTVAMEVKIKDLAYYNESAGRWETEAIEYIVYMGSSADFADLKLKDTFKVVE